MESEIAALFLGYSARKLDQMVKCLAVCLPKLTQEQVWQRQGEYENAIGNLILHLCGNMRQWIMHGVGGAADVRVRDQEFAAMEGHTPEQLLALFENTVAEAKAIIANVPPERLTEQIHPQRDWVSVLEAIYQVVGHAQQHVGQIILVTKQMCCQDLDLTIPRPR